MDLRHLTDEWLAALSELLPHQLTEAFGSHDVRENVGHQRAYRVTHGSLVPRASFWHDGAVAPGDACLE